MPPTTRNKTRLKKHVSAKHQTDDSSNQYAALADTDSKTSTTVETSGQTRPLPNKTKQLPLTLDPHETTKCFENIERTIKDIGGRLTISEEMCHHLLQVMHDRFDALNTQLIGNPPSKIDTST